MRYAGIFALVLSLVTAHEPGPQQGESMKQYAVKHMATEHHIDAFDLESFFRLHDFDQDGYWSSEEIEAIYGVHHPYSQAHSPDKPSHDSKAKTIVDSVLKLLDKNADGFVSLEEFEAVGLDGLPDFSSLGAEGHHYDVESEFFLHHEEIYHSTPETQTDESYTHPEDIAHFEHHEKIELEEENKERAYQGLDPLDKLPEDHDHVEEQPAQKVLTPLEEAAQEAARIADPNHITPMDGTGHVVPEMDLPNPRYTRVPKSDGDPVDISKAAQEAKSKPGYGEGPDGYKRPKNKGDRMRLEDYDEFGNYIGADLDSDDDEQDEGTFQTSGIQQSSQPAPLEGYDENDGPGDAPMVDVDDLPQSTAVVLHENKQYYPSASQVYGEDVETMVQEEDAQPLTEPIIAPVKVRKWVLEEKDLPETRFDKGFLLDTLQYPSMVRNVAVVGHLHHGKTSLMDMLVFETHKLVWDSDRPLRYTDTHPLSTSREISIKSSPLSLILSTSAHKSLLFHFVDTPGHVNFVDEVAAAVRLVDGIILVVDVVEGLMSTTEAVLRHAVLQGVAITLVVNKIDRLILELRIPPADAYYKIKATIEEVNTFLSSIDPNPELRLSPERGNVAFASSQMGYCFTLDSFARLYAETHESLDVHGFGQRLWGDIYFDPRSRKFIRKQGDPEDKRTFVHFILEPLYKLYSQVLSQDSESLKQTLDELGISLKPVMYKMDVRPLLKAVLDQFFGPSTGLVDMLAEWIPAAADASKEKVTHTYTGPMESEVTQSMFSCDPDGPLMVQVTKLYHTADAQDFRAFGRIYSGTIKPGMEIKVLGEGYSPEDEEDMVTAVVENVWISESRYVIPAQEVPAGNLVLIGGVSASISKTATICSLDIAEPHIFQPLQHMTQSVLKVAVEPIAPSELPKMLSGLRSINKSYPLISTKVEESGEHVVLGTGELYLDCVMHDLRKLFSEIEIKVSDPATRFCETVVETSALKCYAETPNKKNKITMIAEPLERGIAEDIESGKVSMKMSPKDRGKFFQEKYEWDLLASRSIWAFGPDDKGPNILIDDTLPSQVDKKLVMTVKDHIKQGFQWGSREGPLCDEPIRNVKFRILDASLAQEPIYRGGGQIVPTSRRVCYSSFLMATPRLMEPIYYVEVQAPADCISAVYTVLARRRGHVTQDIPKAGSPLYTIKALIPVIDANGFETDLRTATQGQAFCLQTFDHWSIVPGDPMDTSIKLRPLEPASGQALARDLVLKTRRRKGLGDQIAVSKYLDDEFVLALTASGHADLLG
ncbi:hypothetical protein FRB99_006147 [Tulasnella sp. 403]|nr:hypothetical protein FRB99_006147 [Tulasnella sp. 403]